MPSRHTTSIQRWNNNDVMCLLGDCFGASLIYWEVLYSFIQRNTGHDVLVSSDSLWPKKFRITMLNKPTIGTWIEIILLNVLYFFGSLYHDCFFFVFIFLNDRFQWICCISVVPILFFISISYYLGANLTHACNGLKTDSFLHEVRKKLRGIYHRIY